MMPHLTKMGNDMKRVTAYYAGSLVFLFVFLTTVDMENGYSFVLDVIVTTCVFMFAFWGRDLIIRYPLLVFLVPAFLLLLALFGIN